MPEEMLMFFTEMSLPSDLDSIIAPSPETEATIPVSIVFSLIAETSSWVFLFDIVTSKDSGSTLSP